MNYGCVQIGCQMIGPGKPCFIGGEIGINGNGDLEIVYKLIKMASRVGCDFVKFQARTVSVVYSEKELSTPREVDRTILDAAINRHVLSEEAVSRIQSSGYTNTTNGDLKRALEFTVPEYRQIAQFCKEIGIAWSVSPWDVESVERMREFNLPFIKIASACLTDDNLLRSARSLGVPVVLSTGMSTLEEVKHAVEVLGRNDLILLHTVSVYPSPEDTLNLRVINTLSLEFPGIPIGYSGHERGTTLTVAARALGACFIERHITLSRDMPGSDHAASLEENGIKLVVNNVRRLEVALGDGIKTVHPTEVPVKKKLRRVC